MIATLRELYEEDTPRAVRFRYALIGFDLATILFVIVTSFFPRATWLEVTDFVLGILILAEFLIRVRLSRQPVRMFLRPATWADAVAVASFLAPIAGEGFGFLRILRTLRLLHSYQLLRRLRRDVPGFAEREEVVIAAVNLVVFLFVMTGLIYATQARVNAQISNYADALYFTVTALTTTGFGDITLEGTSGRMLSVAVMFVGVTLFLRLAQVIFRPNKVHHECPHCGLVLHDADAVHCKHCGTTIHIRTEGHI